MSTIASGMKNKQSTEPWKQRVDSGDWDAITAEVNEYGGALLPRLLTAAETLLPHGHGYVFTMRDRPVRSARGLSAAPVRHGVSAIRSGERHALVFHDAA
jgi:hypothetical protein